MTRAVVLVDGEHYPPVTRQGIDATRSRGYDVVAAVFCGGGEKLSRELELDVPIVRDASVDEALRAAIEQYRPDVIVDLSDDPVVDHVTRMRLAARALSAGVVYDAPGVRLEPPPRPRLARVPTIAVIGTGKRCGKTAVSAHLARTLAGAGWRPVIVAMGRGGPETPVIVRGDLERPTPQALLALSQSGEHAASDVYEDAVVAGVPAVGARRAGAGPAGATAFDTVAEAVVLAETLDPDVIVLEGSGTAIPPVHADATILVARDSDDLGSWPGVHRLLLADLVVVRMAGGKVDPTKHSTLTSPNRDPATVVCVAVTLEPSLLGEVRGRSVYAATTAPVAAGASLRHHLEQAHGARVIGISHRLADRSGLEEDLRAVAGRYDVLACELKAAAVDVAVRAATESGAGIVFIDNRPRSREHDLEDEIMKVAHRAREQFDNR